MNTKHTPTPWKVDQGSYNRTNGCISIVQDKAGVTHSSPVVGVPIYEHDGTATATAAFIVRAVNNHDALVEAAQHIMSIGQSTEECPLCHEEECECWTELARAIKQAKGA